MSETPEVLTAEKLINELGNKRYSKCTLCGGNNLWEIEGYDKLPPMLLCSWCDVEQSRRWKY
jgi:hypothetical protein